MQLYQAILGPSDLDHVSLLRVYHVETLLLLVTVAYLQHEVRLFRPLDITEVVLKVTEPEGRYLGATLTFVVDLAQLALHRLPVVEGHPVLRLVLHHAIDPVLQAL